MSKKSIKETYSDVLFWVTSPMSKGKNYHLTFNQEKVLSKLIHYTNRGVNRYLHYSNESISSHTYISEVYLKKIIPQLNKLGYISISNKKHWNDGEFKTSRTIEVNWDFIETIVQDLPKVKPIKEIEEVTLDSNEEIEVQSKNELVDYKNSFRPQDEIDLFKVLPKIGFSSDDVYYIVDMLEGQTQPMFNEFLKCIKDLLKESKYIDYKGPIFNSKIKEGIKFICFN